jgi:hypothetical protein
MRGEHKEISFACIGEEDCNTITSALKLQELVKERMKQVKGSKLYPHLQSLVEESEK